MRHIKKLLSAVLAVLMVCSCMVVSVSAADDEKISGSFNIINYNIQGVPLPSSETEDGRDAWANSVLIGQKLNSMNYDIVAVQEDFNYDLYFRETMFNYVNETNLLGNLTVRHQTNHSGGVPLGDGLNIFSKFALYNEYRVSWKQSSGVFEGGSDELTNKGFLVTTIKLAEGYYLDVYNIHADAYGDISSVNARKAQYKQLADYIKKHSVYDEVTGTYDHAVIVTGDFNSSICTEDSTGNPYLVSLLLEAAHLNDAWAVQQITEIYENPDDYAEYYTYAKETDLSYEETQGHYDSVERIRYADGNGIDLTCDSFSYNDMYSVVIEMPLSDHCAAEASFSYEIVEKVQDTSHNHDKETVKADKGFILQFLEYLASIFRAIGKLFSGLGKENVLG